jgi:uncharacterized protein (TIGR02246 family)
MTTLPKTIAAFAALAVVATATPALAKDHRKHKMAKMSCAAATQADVEGLFGKFNSAWATKDPAIVTKLFARDAVLLATVSNTPRTDPAAIQDYFVSFLKGSPVGTVNSSTVKIGCNEAYRVGTWTVTLTNPETGAKQDVKARFSFIYGLEDGQWKIRHLHSSMMPEKIG